MIAESGYAWNSVKEIVLTIFDYFKNRNCENYRHIQNDKMKG